MGEKVDIHDLVEFQSSVAKGVETRIYRAQNAGKQLAVFTGSGGGLTGEAAQAISSYVSEFHENGIGTILNQILVEFNSLLTLYLSNYPQVDDGGNDFALSDDDFQKVSVGIKSLKPKFDEKESQLTSIASSVSDIVTSPHESEAKRWLKDVDETFAQMNKRIHKQDENWHRYGNQMSKRFDELDAAITALGKIISQYAGESVGDLSNYERGMFNKRLSKQSNKIFAKLQYRILSWLMVQARK